MKNYALYHSMDLDGWSCGMILKRAGYQVIPYTYGDALPVPLSEIAVMLMSLFPHRKCVLGLTPWRMPFGLTTMLQSLRKSHVIVIGKAN